MIGDNADHIILYYEILKSTEQFKEGETKGGCFHLEQ